VDEQLIKVGDPSGLHFALRWDSEVPSGNASDATDGVLFAWIADYQVWGASQGEARGIGWSWVELLEFLSANWARLRLEESPPFELDVWDPLLLRSEATRRWLQLPRAQVEREQAELWAFEHAHDLARALEGAWARPLWIVREGRSVWLSTSEYRVQQAFEAALATLSELGELIAGRLKDLAHPRAETALSAWRDRDARSTAQLVSYATGLSTNAVQAVAGKRSLEDVWGLSAETIEPNELLAAARMGGPGLSPQSIRKVVDRIRAIPVSANRLLDACSAQAEALLRQEPAGEPFEEGHRLADWFRDEPGVANSTGRVDPDAILENWAVRILELSLEDSSVDAVCCWGPRHGPAVLLNPGGRHARDAGGRRATLAHEIAHLLVDRRGALPLAEVNGGRAPARVEARARAFAAELLLPRRIAGEAFAEAKDPAAETLRLQRRYGVSKEVVAWQARNSMVPFGRKAFQHLKGLVAEPWRYFPLA
jgi:Zn-dependent peptidase ImmA (M78 family)